LGHQHILSKIQQYALKPLGGFALEALSGNSTSSMKLTNANS